MTETSRHWSGTATGDAGPYTDDNDSQLDEDLNSFRDGVLSNVDNELLVYASSPAAKTVDVATGSAIVQGRFYNSDAVSTLTIADNASGQNRIDLIVLTVDYTAQTVRLAVVAGTPAGTPVAPTPTQTAGVLWQEPLAEVEADNGFATIVAADIRDRRSWATLQSSTSEATRGGNLVYNYPSLEVADGTQPEWWEESGGGTLTEEDATGVGIEQIYERILKFVVVTGTTDYLYQRYTHANEPLLDDSTTVISASAKVYTSDAGTITLELYDVGNSKSLATVTTTTEDEWVHLELNSIRVGDTNTDIRIYHSANAATFYVAMPTVNVGRVCMDWKMRGVYFRYKEPNTEVLSTTPDANWNDLDLTANTSAITAAVSLHVNGFDTDTGVRTYVSMRRNGDTTTTNLTGEIAAGSGYTGASDIEANTVVDFMLTDDGQVIELYGPANQETLKVHLRGYWEWE